MLDTALSGAVKEALAAELEFWTSSATLVKLAERNYFGEEGLPEHLKNFIGDSKYIDLHVFCLALITRCLFCLVVYIFLN